VFANEADIAVVVTCHNRVENTLRALERLFDQDGAHGALRIYLVDDGSTDGTAETVARFYPEVRIIKGDGSLYWGGGMALAFSTALAVGHAFYLWLNDDTYLFKDALGRLLAAHREAVRRTGHDAIIVGATRDPVTGGVTSSGVRNSALRRLTYRQVPPTDALEPCVTFQGNCVLIPRRIAEDVGSLDAAFRHYIGDFDYGLRARRRGHQSWIAPGYLGLCRSAPPPPPIEGGGIAALRRAWSLLRHPKGAPFVDGPLYSFQEWGRFASRHGGPLWLFYFAYPYRRLLKFLLPRPGRRA
jgi:GT2 family glycosyltransferase